MLSIGNDAKTVKGEKLGILTAILYLAPLNIARDYLKSIGDAAWKLLKNVCPWASKGCGEGCLNTAGRGAFNNVQKARINKTRLFFVDRTEFFARTRKAIGALIRKAKRAGYQVDFDTDGNKVVTWNLTPCVRLNGTSDLPWESLVCPDRQTSLITEFPELQFYDYTKSFHRMVKFVAAQNFRKNPLSQVPFAYFAENYHLTFSRSEDNEPECISVLQSGGTVAVVFAGPANDKKALPETWHGFPVVSGDDTDVRFFDTPGTVIGLTAKGKARKDSSGFVVRYDSSEVLPTGGAWAVR